MKTSFSQFLRNSAGAILKRQHVKAQLQHKRYGAASTERAAQGNNDGAPPINGVSNARYYQ